MVLELIPAPGLPSLFSYRNLGQVKDKGFEVGVDASVSYTRFDGTNVTSPTSPVGDSYASKVVGDIAYRPAGGRFTVGYTVRHQGEQREVIVGTNPIGTVIPAFTVHSARASALLLDRFGVRNSLVLTGDNLGNALYAEFPNASFFRPEAGRGITLSLVTAF